MVRKFSLGLLILLPLFLFLIFKRKKGKSQSTSKITPQEPEPLPTNPQLPTPPFTQKELKVSVLVKRLQEALAFTEYSNYGAFWMAIAKMETADFESKVFTVANNPWNMEKPHDRDTTALPTAYAGRWATYSSLKGAAGDIVLYMKAKRFKANLTDLERFVQEMGRLGYYGTEPSSEYYSKVKAWQAR